MSAGLAPFTYDDGSVVRTIVIDGEPWFVLADLCKVLDEKLIFVKHAPCGAVQYDFYAQYAHHFQTREKVVEHQWGTCSHYTLQILPRGVELIHRRIREQRS